MAQPFIQLNSRDGPQPIPVPPNHPPPQARPPPQQQPMMPGPFPAQFPPPPPDAVPRDLQMPNNRLREMNRLSSEISDLRLNNMTEAQARERLSTYHVVRLVKTDDPHEFDDYHGKPTWERVHLSMEDDISQLEARRQVRHLEETTKSVTEKKKECIPSIQQQLEHARDRLSGPDLDPRFTYTLVQFDSKLKRLEGRDAEVVDKSGKKDKHKKEKRYVSTSKKGKSKRKFERIAITAYFKRSPTSDQNCIRMLKEQEMRKEGAMVPPQPQLPLPHRPMPPMQLQPPPPAPPAKGPQPPPPQALPPVKFPPAGPLAKGNDKGKKGKVDEKKPKPRQQSHSSSSGSSGDYSGSDGSEAETPESSISSRSSKHHRGRSPTPAYRHPKFYGQPAVTRPRRHTKDALEYDFGYEVVPGFAVPAHTRPGGRVRLIRPAEDDHQGYIPRRAPAPRIIQEFRYVSSPEMQREVLRNDIERADRRIHRSRLNAIHRDEDIRLDNDRIDRLGEDILYREDLRRELREVGGNRWSEPRAQQFMHQRIEDPSRHNPFLSRRRRPDGGYHN